LQEGLLYGVLGVLCVAEQASRRGEHSRSFAPYESRECCFIATTEAFDDRVGAFARRRLARGSVEELGDVAGASAEDDTARSKRLQYSHARKVDERNAAQIEGEGRRRGEAPVGEPSELGDGIARDPPLDEQAGLGFAI